MLDIYQVGEWDHVDLLVFDPPPFSNCARFIIPITRLQRNLDAPDHSSAGLVEKCTSPVETAIRTDYTERHQATTTSKSCIIGLRAAIN